MLLGDSAHTHGPIGAQGINLALQDAVVLHPVLVGAVRAKDTGVHPLYRFEEATAARRHGGYSDSRHAGAGDALPQPGRRHASAPVLARVVSRTPLYRRVLHKLAHGPDAVRIRADLFTRP